MALNEHTRRTLIACLVAPLAVPVFVTASVILIPSFPFTRVNMTAWHPRLIMGLYLSAVPTVIALATTLAVVLPIRLAQLEKGAAHAGWLRHLVFGALAGIAPPTTFGLFVYLYQGSTLDFGLDVLLLTSGIGAALGVAVASLYLLVLGRTSPARDHR